jgi:hypothetical protein
MKIKKNKIKRREKTRKRKTEVKADINEKAEVQRDPPG